MRIPLRMLAAGAVALAVGLAGCSGPGATDPTATGSAEPATIRYAVENPDHLLPANHFASYAILMALFAPLTTVDDNGELGYLQAESVESADAVTWTIKLKPGWTFHNGEAVTAKSYVDAWNYAAYSENANVNGAQLRGVVGYDAVAPAKGEPKAKELAGLKVVDDLTFTVQLNGPDRQFPLQLTAAQTGLYPLPSVAYDDMAKFDRMPLGNGPFKLVSEWVDNQPLETVAYDGYQGPAPTLDAVTFVPYVDTTSAYTDALAGSVDILAIAANQAVQARNDFGDRLYELDAPGVDFLGFNLADPRFDDPRVRRAISMSIDRAAINEAVFGGSQVPATSLTAPSMPGDPQGVCGEACEFNPDKAKALLAEAGGLDGDLEILFIANWGQDDLFEAIANQIRQNLGIANVVATPAADFAAFTEKVNTDKVKGPFRARWGALYPSMQNTLHAVYTAAGEGNFGAGGYSNPEVDELLKQADAAASIGESYEGYVKAQERILADFPTVPLFGNRYLYVTSDKVAELKTASGGVELTQVVLAG